MKNVPGDLGYERELNLLIKKEQKKEQKAKVDKIFAEDVKNVDYSFYSKLEAWTHKTAACLFHDLSPESDLLTNFVVPSNLAPLAKDSDLADKFVYEVKKTYIIFSTADFLENYRTNKNHIEHYRPLGFFLLADQLEITVSPEMLKVKKIFQDREKKANKETLAISEKMLKTLQPTIQIIEDFAGSDRYKEYGSGVQIQFIEEWLKKHVKNSHEKRYLKDLITRHYDIKAARKKTI